LDGYLSAQKIFIDKFSDASKVPSWSKDALNWAFSQGIITGKNGKLGYAGNATRAECASMMKKCLKRIKNKGV